MEYFVTWIVVGFICGLWIIVHNVKSTGVITLSDVLALIPYTLMGFLALLALAYINLDVEDIVLWRKK